MASLHAQARALAGELAEAPVWGDSHTTTALRALVDALRTSDVEATARLLSSWPAPGLVDQADAVLAKAVGAGQRGAPGEHADEDAVGNAKLALLALGHAYRVGAAPARLRRLFDLLNPSSAHYTPALHSAVLAALETAARGRASRLKGSPSAYWTLPGYLDGGAPPVAAAAAATVGVATGAAAAAGGGGHHMGTVTPPRALQPASIAASPSAKCGYLSLSWQHWPFRREFGFWTMVRLRPEPSAAAAGAADSAQLQAHRATTSLLRVVAGNGARLHIWASHRRLHIEVQEVVQVPPTATTSSTSSSSNPLSAAGDLFGRAAAKAASAVRDKIQSAAGGGVGAAAPGAGAGGVFKAEAAAPSLVPGAWVSVYVHLARRKGLLTGPQHELTVSVDGAEVLARVPDVPFPRALSAAPLALARAGEGLCGELGPLVFWGDASGPGGAPGDRTSVSSSASGVGGGSGSIVGPASTQALADLTAGYCGDAVALLPRAIIYSDAGFTGGGSSSGAGAASSAGDAGGNGPPTPSVELPSSSAYAPLPRPYAIYHPAHGHAHYGGYFASGLVATAGGAAGTGSGSGGAAGTPTGLGVTAALSSAPPVRSVAPTAGDACSCVCPDLVGGSATSAAGYNHVAAIAPTSIRDALQELGGAPALLPLFGSALAAQLEYQAERNGQQRHHELSPDAAAVAAYDPDADRRSLAAQSMDVLSAFLADHIPLCQGALQACFTRLLRLELVPLMRRPLADSTVSLHDGAAAVAPATRARVRPPAHSDPAVVTSMLALAQSGCAVVPELRLDAWKTLLCWLPAYAHASFDVQLALLLQLRSAARLRPELFRSDIGVAFLVESLLAWYSAVCAHADDAAATPSDDLLLGRHHHTGGVGALGRRQRRASIGDATSSASAADAGAAAVNAGNTPRRVRSSSAEPAAVPSTAAAAPAALEAGDAPAAAGGSDATESTAPADAAAADASSSSEAPAIAAEAATAASAAAPPPPQQPRARTPTCVLPFAQRHRLLREFLRLIGCALGASPVFLPAAEAGTLTPGSKLHQHLHTAGSGGGASSAATASTTSSSASLGGVAASSASSSSLEALSALPDVVQPLRKRDMEPLVQLLSHGLDCVPAVSPEADDDDGADSDTADLPSPRDLLRAELLCFFSALLDYDASHVAGDSAHYLLAAAPHLHVEATAAAAAAAGAPQPSSSAPAPHQPLPLDPHVLVASGGLGALAVLDACCHSDFVSTLILGVLPGSRCDALTAAAVRALGQALRANQGRPGRWNDAPANAKAVGRTGTRTSSDRERLSALVQTAVAVGALRAPSGGVTAPGAAAPLAPSSKTAFPGAFWSRDLQRWHGCSVLFHLLRDGSGGAAVVGPHTAGALLELALVPDAAELLLNVELDPANEAVVAMAATAGPGGSAGGATGGAPGGGGDDGEDEALCEASRVAAMLAAFRYATDHEPLQVPLTAVAASGGSGDHARHSSTGSGHHSTYHRSPWYHSAMRLSLAPAPASPPGTALPAHQPLRARATSSMAGGASSGVPQLMHSASTSSALPGPSPSTYHVSSQCALMNPALLSLALRLLPHMAPPAQAHTLQVLLALLRASDANRAAVLRHVPAWEMYLYRALLPLVPSAYPPREATAAVDAAASKLDATAASPPLPYAATGGGDGAGSSGSFAASSDVDAAYAAGEECLLLLCRASMNHVGGWRPFARLFAMQPLLTPSSSGGGGAGERSSAEGSLPSLPEEDGDDGAGPAPATAPGGGSASSNPSTLGRQWPLPLAAMSRGVRHGHRLIALVVSHTLADFDSARTRTITRGHVENLLHITALVEREVAAGADDATDGAAASNRGVTIVHQLSQSARRIAAAAAATSSVAPSGEADATASAAPEASPASSSGASPTRSSGGGSSSVNMFSPRRRAGGASQRLRTGGKARPPLAKRSSGGIAGAAGTTASLVPANDSYESADEYATDADDDGGGSGGGGGVSVTSVADAGLAIVGAASAIAAAATGGGGGGGASSGAVAAAGPTGVLATLGLASPRNRPRSRIPLSSPGLRSARRLHGGPAFASVGSGADADATAAAAAAASARTTISPTRAAFRSARAAIAGEGPADGAAATDGNGALRPQLDTAEHVSAANGAGLSGALSPLADDGVVDAASGSGSVTGDRELRFDAVMASCVLQLWDRLLAPASDKADEILSQVPPGLAVCGSLRHQLLSLSLWALHAYPAWHAETMRALLRLPQLTAGLLKLVTQASLTAGGRTSSGSGSSAPAASEAAGAPASDGWDWDMIGVLGRRGLPSTAVLMGVLWACNDFLRRLQADVRVLTTGSNAGPGSSPTPIDATQRLIDDFTAQTAAAAVAATPTDDGAAVATLPPPTLAPERPVLVSVDGVRLRMLASEVLSQAAASADLALLFLSDVFTSCPAGTSAAVAHPARLQAFLEGYQLFRAGSRSAESLHSDGGGAAGFTPSAAHPGTPHAATTAPPLGAPPSAAAAAAQPSYTQPSGWAWLIGDMRVPPGTGATDASSAGAPPQRPPSLDSAASSAWVLHPSWAEAVPDALEAASGCAALACEGVDALLDGAWRRVVHHFRADVAIIAPIRALQRAAAAEAGAIDGLPSSGRLGRQQSGAGSGMTSAVLLSTAASNVASSAARFAESLPPINTLTPQVAADFGRSALRRITSQVREGVTQVKDQVKGSIVTAVRQGVKKGIGAGIAALAQVFDADGGAGGGGDGAGLGGVGADALLAALLTASDVEAMEHAFTGWLPEDVIRQIGSIDVVTPGWWFDGWRRSHEAGTGALRRLRAAEAARRWQQLVRREDFHFALRRAHRRVLKALIAERAAWGGEYAFTAGVPSKLATALEDAHRRRMVVTRKHDAVDYEPARYSAGNAHGSGPSSASSSASASLSTAAGAGAAATRQSAGPAGAGSSAPADGSAAAPPAAGGSVEQLLLAGEDREMLASVAKAVAAAAKARAPERSAGDDDEEDESAAPTSPPLSGAAAAALARGGAVPATPAGGADSTPGTPAIGGGGALQAAVASPGLLLEDVDGLTTLDGDAVYAPAPGGALDGDGGRDSTSSADAGASGGGDDRASGSGAQQAPAAAIKSSASFIDRSSAGSTAAVAASSSSTAAAAAAAAAATAAASTTPGSLALLPGEQLVLDVRSKHVTRDRILAGRLKLTTQHVVFEPARERHHGGAGGGPAPMQRQLSGLGGGGSSSLHTHGILPDEEDDHTAAGQLQPGGGGFDLAPPAPAAPKRADRVYKRHHPPRPRRWALSLLARVLPRRYLLQPCALELFFADGSSAFLVVPSSRLRLVFEALWAQHPPLLSTGAGAIKSLQPRKHLTASRLQEAWVHREISNFDYLMALNTLAGRSFNDLTQYPVMPWVIADYTSPVLDLADPSTYRDLSKPVGALNPARLRTFRDRAEGLALGGAGDIPPFLYGSHYSSAGIVLFYLLRMEPFTSLAVELQGGRFDCADRLFFSVPECWRGVNNSMSDVKEVIPEWYTTPEMFVNAGGLPLGELQDGRRVGDVVLPPWARTPHEFVWLNRAALESEHVSSHLHGWIDLIFGHKQRGPAADAADNLFYYLTYEDAVDLEGIADPVLRASTEAQIIHFGQTPGQLFRKPHPPRAAPSAATPPLFAYDCPLGRSPPGRPHPVGRVLSGAHRVLTVTAAAGGTGAGGAAAAAAPGPARLPTMSVGAGTPSFSLAAFADEGVLLKEAAPATAIAVATPTAAADLTQHGLSVYTAAYHPATGASAAASAQAAARAGVQSLLAAGGTGGGGGGPSSAAAALPTYDGRDAASLPALLTGPALSAPFDAQLALTALVGGRLAAVHGDASLAQHRFTPLMTEGGLPYEMRADTKPRPLAAAALAALAQPASLLLATSVVDPPDVHALLAREPGAHRGASAAHALYSTACGGLWSLPPSNRYAVVVPQAPGSAGVAAGAPAAHGAVGGASAGGQASAAGGGGGGGGGGDPLAGSPAAVLFSCGYVDSCLRWQTLGGGGSGRGGGGGSRTGDVWHPRSATARLGDVTCVAAPPPPALPSAPGAATGLLVTGHATGSLTVWAVVSNDADDIRAACERVLGPWRYHRHAGYMQPVSPSGVLHARGPASDVALVALGCLRGHTAPVTCASVNQALGVVASGALDGCVALHSLRTGQLLRIVTPASAGLPAALSAARIPLPPPPPPAPSAGATAAAHGDAAGFPVGTVPVAHVVLSTSGYAAVHWRTRVHAPDAPSSAAAGSSGAQQPSPSAGAPFVSVLGNVHVNGTVVAVGPAAHLSGPATPYITALTATAPDGSAVLVGLSDGCVQVRHGLTLECGGYVQLHDEPPWGSALGASAAAAAVAAAPAATGGGGLLQLGDSLRTSAQRAFSMAIRRLADSDGGGGALTAPGAPLGARPSSAAAVTCLSLIDDGKMLLAGTGDGRLVVVADLAVTARELQKSLQASLFSLV